MNALQKSSNSLNNYLSFVEFDMIVKMIEALICEIDMSDNHNRSFFVKAFESEIIDFELYLNSKSLNDNVIDRLF